MRAPSAGMVAGLARALAGRLCARVLILVLAAIIAAPLIVLGLECGSCGAKGISALAMFCPRCRESLHTPQTQKAVRSTAALSIDIAYTGDQPERLPDYGKIFINGVYKGNIPIAEREARRRDVDSVYTRGLGHEYTAKYHTVLRELDVGMFRVEIEMRFKRLYGFIRSHRRVCFPYVALRSGEKTSISHSFSHGTSFQDRKLASATPFLQIIPGLPGLPGLPTLIEMIQLRPGTGTLGIEVPFFD